MLRIDSLKPVFTRTAFVILLALLAACAEPETPAIEGDLAFLGVNVVDVKAGSIIPQQTVVIEDGKIARILPANAAALDAKVTVVDASGQYLAPGLMDMHTHMASPEDLALTLAHGVTTVRVMWGQPSTLELRAKVEAGEIPGPRIVTAGDLMDGHPPIWGEMGMEANAYTDPAAMDEVVAAQQAAGYDFIKTYSRLTPEVFAAILEAGNEHGMEVSGHVPQDMPIRDAIAGGMRTSEHFIGVMAAVLRDDDLPNPDLAAFDPRAKELVLEVGEGAVDPGSLIDFAKVRALAEYAAAQDHWFVPTHDIMRNFTTDYQRPFARAERYMSAQDRALYEVIAEGSFFNLTPTQKKGESLLYELRTQVLGAFHEAGAKILAGTDHSKFSAFAMLEEIKALHQAGFSRPAALRAATYEPGRYLARPDGFVAGDLGVVAEGAVADLILIEGDPLQDLDTLTNLRGVMARGQWRDRAELDAMLDEIAARAAASGEGGEAL